MEETRIIITDCGDQPTDCGTARIRRPSNCSRCSCNLIPNLQTCVPISPQIQILSPTTPIGSDPSTPTHSEVFITPSFAYNYGRTSQQSLQSNIREKNSRSSSMPPVVSHTPIYLSPRSGCPNISPASTIGPICRICHDNEKKEPLISPCTCSGSMRSIHKSCLERWLSTMGGSSCEVCHYSYHIDKIPLPNSKYLTTLESSLKHALKRDVICCLIITPLVLMSTYLCCLGAINFYEKFYDNAQRIQNLRTSYSAGFPNATFEEITQGEDMISALTMEFTGIVMLAVIVLLIYLMWLTIAVRFHIETFKNWRKNNHMVRLACTGDGNDCEKCARRLRISSNPSSRGLSRTSQSQASRNSLGNTSPLGAATIFRLFSDSSVFTHSWAPEETNRRSNSVGSYTNIPTSPNNISKLSEIIIQKEELDNPDVSKDNISVASFEDTRF